MTEQLSIKPNRAMRRAAAKAKPIEYTKLAEPRYLDKWRIFDATTRILDQLENGDVHIDVDGDPFFIGIDGDKCKTVPALDGWIMFWQEAQKQLNLPIDTVLPFLVIRKRLKNDVVITVASVARAQAALAQQRKYYDTLPRDELTRIANTVRIKLYLE